MESVYDLYQRGCELLEHGDHQAAIVSLSKARDLEPDKDSIREALGRALFHAQHYECAAAEFQAAAAKTVRRTAAMKMQADSRRSLCRRRRTAALSTATCDETAPLRSG